MTLIEFYWEFSEILNHEAIGDSAGTATRMLDTEWLVY